MPSRATTRRAPWMESYVSVVKFRHGKGSRYVVNLKMDNQQFMLSGGVHSEGFTRSEARFMRDMLCIALNRFRTTAMLDAIKMAALAVEGTMKNVPAGD